MRKKKTSVRTAERRAATVSVENQEKWREFGYQTKADLENYLRDFAYEPAKKNGRSWTHLRSDQNNIAIGFLLDQLDEARRRAQRAKRVLFVHAEAHRSAYFRAAFASCGDTGTVVQNCVPNTNLCGRGFDLVVLCGIDEKRHHVWMLNLQSRVFPGGEIVRIDPV